ncbi:MAG: hypothetical protein PHC61_05125 [Chitinivibrionales bacterium]|nr:hypothetical protein [Chitinivibrionales bacterium]
MNLLLFLIFFPLIIAAILLITPANGIRKFVVRISAAAIGAGSIALLPITLASG